MQFISGCSSEVHLNKHQASQSYLRHLSFTVASEKREVVDLILNHKVLLFSLEILYENKTQKETDIEK